MAILVTGGAGFVGSTFIRAWLARNEELVVNLDLLTYAGDLRKLEDLQTDPRHVFIKGDVCDASLVDAILQRHQPRAVVHFAAESNVDRSIDTSASFIQTNVVGTHVLLEAARRYIARATPAVRSRFRFLHVGTDEVYGSLGPGLPPFTEASPYEPNSPYSASKAASNHLVRAWHQTYGMPVLTANSCNSYGPHQHLEKFVPRMIVNGLAGTNLPIYGDGRQVRDWLHVSDQCAALRAVLEQGTLGETYNIGGWNEHTNIDVVRSICQLLDHIHPEGSPHERLIMHVTDRPGHDRRYAIDASKIERMLGWRPKLAFADGLRSTVQWYAEHLPKNGASGIHQGQ
jgi:dTDP-glucose 4,6-dehydratase